MLMDSLFLTAITVESQPQSYCMHGKFFLLFCLCVNACSFPKLECQPLAFSPFYESENLDKLDTTLGKISAYLEKADANQWWRSWLSNARSLCEAEPAPTEGNHSLS